MLEGITASDRIKAYLTELDTKTKHIHELANQARKAGLDPELYVDVPLTLNAAERVEGLVASVAPQIKGKGMPERIVELEKTYGPGDWRVALTIAKEIAQNKFGEFEKQIEAITTGVRAGLAYITQGTVSAPLEGVVELRFKKRKDGEKYLAIYYAGPIRGAGGTPQSVSVLLADYVRKELGIAEYDPTEEEINRYHTEVIDYYDRVERKQYRPTPEEMKMIISNLKVELNGDPTSDLEVSNYKHLERVETNNIRGGMALVLTDGLPLKAAKLWAQLRKWGKDFDLEHWNWIPEFLKLKEKLHAKKTEESTEKVREDFVFLSEMVAGRPVFTYPLAKGGFRLRYGRSRATGHGTWAVSPVTMQVLNNYIATGTQLRVERPGKSTALTACDSINGPIVKLEDGSVVKLESEEQAKKVKNKIQEIIFLGDILISHGDFFEQGHILLPAGYCHEWWLKEAEKAGIKINSVPTLEEAKKLAENTSESQDLDSFPRASESKAFQGIPLHPNYIFFWSEISAEQFRELYSWLRSSEPTTEGKLILDITNAKRALELIGCPHQVHGNKIIISKENTDALKANLSDFTKEITEEKTTLEIVNKLSDYKIKDLSGHTIGARMGRPEKAKMRKMKGSPHVLFPVGKEGGRLRCFQAALEAKKVTSDFPIFECENCNQITIYPTCDTCGSKTAEWRICPVCKKKTKKDKCHRNTIRYDKIALDIPKYFAQAKSKLEINKAPDLIKGVRGTSNKDHIPEHLSKGILRAKHNVYVNKDGTIRYDLSELPITHFKPAEIGLSIEKAKELGYTKDIHGNELTDSDQVLELYPQDIILPACRESDDEGADEVLLRVSQFVDDELTYIYKQKPFYCAKNPEDLIGQLLVGLAPHTSAGVIGRLIGFSKVVCILAHPYYHSAMRRDCDGEETSVILAMDCFLNFSRQYLPDHRGGRSVSGDTILFLEINGKLEIKEARELIDELFEKYGFVKEDSYEILRNCPEHIKAFSFDPEIGDVRLCDINTFIRHINDKQMYKIKTTNGSIKVTEDHSLFITRGKSISSVQTKDLRRGDAVVVLDKLDIPKQTKDQINVLELLNEKEAYIIPEQHNLSDLQKAPITKDILAKFGRVNPYRYCNGSRAAPYSFYKMMGIKPNSRIRTKADSLSIPQNITLNNSFFRLLGYIISEGHICRNGIEIVNTNEEVVEDIKRAYINLFKSEPNIRISIREHKKDCYRIQIPIVFSNVLKQLGLKQAKSGEKEIPSFVFRASKENILAFLDSYLLGDGTRRKEHITLFTASRKLSAGLSLLAYLVGLKSGVSKINRSGNRQPIYNVSIANQKLRDPYWPLWEYTKELYNELRHTGLTKSKVTQILSNIRGNKRMKTCSKNKILDIIRILQESELKNELSNLLKSDIKTERIVSIKKIDYSGYVYDLEVPETQNFLCGPHPIFAHNSMDAPLVLSTVLNPMEVDDECYFVNTCWDYPLEFYEAAETFKAPWDLKIEQIKDRLNKPEQYEGMGFTHSISSINDGVRVSAYKSIPTMLEKVEGQMDLARKIRAVDFPGTAALIIEKHFIRDIKGNLRKFTLQGFRCVYCNAKYRRLPISGKCTECTKGRLIYTIAEGSIKKYLEHTIKLSKLIGITPYLRQSIELLKERVDSVFGEEKTKQVSLGEFTS